VDEATGATINVGAENVNGQVLIDLQPGSTRIANSFQSSPLTFIDVSNGLPDWYVNIKSVSHPNGEIRGKIEFNPLEVFNDTLSAQKVVSSVRSNAVGNAELQYDSALNKIFFYINTTASGVTKVVLRGPASTRSSGAELAVLCSFKCAARLLYIGALTEGSTAFLNRQTLESTLTILRQGKAYIEVQTTQNPNGELRANLPPARIVSTQVSLRFLFPIDRLTPNTPNDNSVPQTTPIPTATTLKRRRRKPSPTTA